MSNVTISSIGRDFEGIDALLRAVPQVSPMFDVNASKGVGNFLGVFVDGALCGIILYSVVNVGAREIFYVSAAAVDSDRAGRDLWDVVYPWLENEAKKLGCDFLVFDSARRGAVKHAIKYGFTCTNCEFSKGLK